MSRIDAPLVDSAKMEDLKAQAAALANPADVFKTLIPTLSDEARKALALEEEIRSPKPKPTIIHLKDPEMLALVQASLVDGFDAEKWKIIFIGAEQIYRCMSASGATPEAWKALIDVVIPHPRHISIWPIHNELFPQSDGSVEIGEPVPYAREILSQVLRLMPMHNEGILRTHILEVAFEHEARVMGSPDVTIAYMKANGFEKHVPEFAGSTMAKSIHRGHRGSLYPAFTREHFETMVSLGAKLDPVSAYWPLIASIEKGFFPVVMEAIAEKDREMTLDLALWMSYRTRTTDNKLTRALIEAGAAFNHSVPRADFEGLTIHTALHSSGVARMLAKHVAALTPVARERSMPTLQHWLKMSLGGSPDLASELLKLGVRFPDPQKQLSREMRPVYEVAAAAFDAQAMRQESVAFAENEPSVSKTRRARKP